MKEFTRRKALIMIGGAAAATSSCSGAGTSDAVETDLTTSLAQSPTSAAEQAQAPEATSSTEVISRRSWNAEPAGAGMKAHEQLSYS